MKRTSDHKRVIRLNGQNQKVLWEERGAQFFADLPKWIPCAEKTVEANIISSWRVDERTTGQAVGPVSYADARRQGVSTYNHGKDVFYRPDLRHQEGEYWAAKWGKPKFTRAWVSKSWPTTAMSHDYQVSAVHIVRIHLQESMPIELMEI